MGVAGIFCEIVLDLDLSEAEGEGEGFVIGVVLGWMEYGDLWTWTRGIPLVQLDSSIIAMLCLAIIYYNILYTSHEVQIIHRPPGQTHASTTTTP